MYMNVHENVSAYPNKKGAKSRARQKARQASSWRFKPQPFLAKNSITLASPASSKFPASPRSLSSSTSVNVPLELYLKLGTRRSNATALSTIFRHMGRKHPIIGIVYFGCINSSASKFTTLSSVIISLWQPKSRKYII